MRVQIETKRLLLRNLVPDDAEAVFLWSGDPTVNEFMVYPLYTKVEDVRTWIESLDPDNPDDYDLGFVRKDTGELIGAGGLTYRADRDVWIVGYNLRADQWGNGYTVEAIEGIIEHVMKSRQVRCLEAGVAIDNHNSMRIMEKLNMIPVAESTYEKLDGSMIFHDKIYRREL